MHQVILVRLEEYLSGSPSSREFTAHLQSCDECRAEVREMLELSGVLQTIRDPEPLAPPPGFYARVAQRIETQRPRSIWSLFWIEPAFGKRVAFASLMTLAILGSYLISHEADYSTGPSNPEVIMAQQATGENPDTMLATLASYEP
jgi:predicted anti-sigma-YlaC factor YlaD